tara:strand:- start:6 stop:200 length:195 start_codon:yes stop_codon:yes gene_type:complete
MTNETTYSLDLMAEAITQAIRFGVGFDAYDDTEMLVTQGLLSWGHEDLVEKAAEFDIDLDECKD